MTRRGAQSQAENVRSSVSPSEAPPSQLAPVILGTQAEQDQVDEDARRKAMKDLVGSWNDRLQLISLITTFMASVEAGLLQVTSPDPDNPSVLLDASNGCLLSALIIHLHASFISFVGAFFLLISLITTFMASVEAGLLQVTSPDPDNPSVLLDASNGCLLSALIIHLHASFISFVGAFFLVRFKVKEAKRTQAEQDQVDEDARRKAMKDLVGSWNDRLQLISLITTFMASVEAGLLQVTSPDPDNPSVLLDASNGCLLSALIIHLHASFISFVGAFFLVRFKVKEAKRAEDRVEGVSDEQPSKGSIILDMAAKQITNSPDTGSPNVETLTPPPRSMATVWSANPQLVQVGPFLRQPPINLLSR
ncbi:hypothetical protein PQX77_012501 [Marasmius sp. AFHP31]|nr:hypothetical protein PQX77_012501 [Marasmius sp. AFHP31]